MCVCVCVCVHVRVCVCAINEPHLPKKQRADIDVKPSHSQCRLGMGTTLAQESLSGSWFKFIHTVGRSKHIESSVSSCS